MVLKDGLISWIHRILSMTSHDGYTQLNSIFSNHCHWISVAGEQWQGDMPLSWWVFGLIYEGFSYILADSEVYGTKSLDKWQDNPKFLSHIGPDHRHGVYTNMYHSLHITFCMLVHTMKSLPNVWVGKPTRPGSSTLVILNTKLRVGGLFQLGKNSTLEFCLSSSCSYCLVHHILVFLPWGGCLGVLCVPLDIISCTTSWETLDMDHTQQRTILETCLEELVLTEDKNLTMPLIYRSPVGHGWT